MQETGQENLHSIGVYYTNSHCIQAPCCSATHHEVGGDMQTAKQKMTMQKWTAPPPPPPSMWAGCDAVPVGCWRHSVCGWGAWCGGFWWTAAHVIINGTNPENGQCDTVMSRSDSESIGCQSLTRTNRSRTRWVSSVMLGQPWILIFKVQFYFTTTWFQKTSSPSPVVSPCVGVVMKCRHQMPPAGRTG